MSAGSDATKYFGSAADIAREKDAPPRQAASSAPPTVGLTENMKRSAEKRAAKSARLAAKKAKEKEIRQITKKLDRLTMQADEDEKLRLLNSIALRGLRHAEGLLKQREEAGYNADADVPLADATTRSQFGMKVYTQMMAKDREAMVTQRALGVVLLQGRQSEEEWNESARRVDEAQRRAHASDVAAEMIKNGEVE